MFADVHGVDRAAALREEFDRGFASEWREPPPTEDLLEIGLGSTLYALRVSEMGGLAADLPITAVPSPIPELLGIAGRRGVILPIYDLRALLGAGPGAGTRWIAVAAAMPVGLAFDRFERHVRVRRDALVPQGGADGLRHVRDVVRLENGLRPIVSIAALLEALTVRVRAAAPGKA